MSVPEPADPSLLLTILRELPTGVGVARAPGGELLYANRTYSAILGTTPGDEGGLAPTPASYRVCDRAGRPYPVDRLPFARVMRERKTVVVEDIVIERGDGSRANVRALAKPLLDRAGEISHVMVAFDDITAHVETEAAGNEARQRLETALDHAPIVLFAIDRDGIVTVSQGAALRAMGFRSGELVGRSAFELYKDNPQVLDNQRRVLAGETFTTVTELGEVVLETWMAPLRDGDGAVRGVIGVSTDVSERLRLQRQMAQGDRLSALGRLAASVAHEINNPLAYAIEALRLAGELVGELESAPGAAHGERLARLRRLVGDASEGADRVRLITRDLKAFSRPDQDARVPVDLQRCLAAAIKLVAKRTATRARVELRPGPTAIVRADENRLVQIFINLVLNAADALPPGGADRNLIRIGSRLDGDVVVVDVADNGPGIPADVRARIFEPFFTTKPVGEGTGLGLFVTRNLVDALGGSVTVGDAPEGGALFSVRLPVDGRVASSLAPAPAPPAVPRPLGRWRILIVDDDPQVAQLLKLSLAGDCEVESFTSARAALSHLATGAPYHLMFCDLMMGEQSGMSFYEELRRMAPGREREVVFMTGGVFDAAVSDFLASVPNDCVDKPFDIRAEVDRRLGGLPDRP